MTSGALVDLFPDRPGETFPLYIVRPSRRLPPAAVEAFLDFASTRAPDAQSPADRPPSASRGSLDERMSRPTRR